MSNISKAKRLGQNFLHEQGIISLIISGANIHPGDQVIEIGPGKGVVTAALLNAKAKVLAIEKDPRLVKFLRKHFSKASNLEIIQADIRDFLRNPEFENLKLKIKNYKVVGNIPYYLTSHLIRLLLEVPVQPTLIILMVQKEVAKRIVAQPPKMNLLAVSVQYYAHPKIITYVPRTAFSPQPKVDSAIIKLTPHSVIPADNSVIPAKAVSPNVIPAKAGISSFSPNRDSHKNNKREPLQSQYFFQVVKAGFSHPRKLLSNNLPYGLKIPKIKIEKILTEMNLPANVRAQNLSLRQWQYLTRKITSLKKNNIV